MMESLIWRHSLIWWLKCILMQLSVMRARRQEKQDPPKGLLLVLMMKVTQIQSSSCHKWETSKGQVTASIVATWKQAALATWPTGIQLPLQQTVISMDLMCATLQCHFWAQKKMKWSDGWVRLVAIVMPRIILLASQTVLIIAVCESDRVGLGLESKSEFLVFNSNWLHGCMVGVTSNQWFWIRIRTTNLGLSWYSSSAAAFFLYHVRQLSRTETPVTVTQTVAGQPTATLWPRNVGQPVFSCLGCAFQI